MRKIFSLLVILGIIFVFGCGKESTETITGAYEIDELDVIEDAEEDKVIEEEETVTVRLCYDSDNGMVKWVNGTVFGFYNNAERFEFNDYCFDNSILVEYYCDEGEIPQNMTFVCENGCEGNHCK